MRRSQPLRVVAAAAAVLIMVLTVIAVLAASNLAFSVYDQLSARSHWLALAYLALLILFAATGGIIVWRLLAPAPERTSPKPLEVPDEVRLRNDIERHGSTGVAVQAAQTELRELEQRRATGQVYVALYGEISAGKTSLIRALVPGAQADVDIRGGTTRGVNHYRWQTPSGDSLVVADVPGLNLAGEKMQPEAEEEALRAHLVVYVCEGDLTRDQWDDLERLRRFGKPIIVAINKKDRYGAEDLARIRERIQERLTDDTQVVAIQSGGREELIRVLPNGQEQRVERERPAQVEDLNIALQSRLVEQGELLDQLRDKAMFLLTASKLEHALGEYRHKTAEEIVTRYTRRAVIGGLAAFAPGADLVIQGALAVALVRALSELYDVKVRQIDLDKLLNTVSGRVGRSVPLILAVVGNALKAFPGTGTVAGGVAHAVAYGLLFQSLGRALAETLSRQGALDTQRTVQAFEEQLNENLATRAKGLVSLALAQARKREP